MRCHDARWHWMGAAKGPTTARQRVLCRSKKAKTKRTKRRRERPSESGVVEEETVDDGQEMESGRPLQKEEGWAFFPADKEQEAYERAVKDEMTEDLPFIDMTNPSSASPAEEPLPEVTREQVLGSCVYVSAGIFAMSLVLRAYASRATEVLGSDPVVVQSLLSWNPPFKLEHAGVALAAAAAVSVARIALYQNWRDFTIATDRSNGQVLRPLNFVDICVVSFVPGIAEEMLFRGGLVPALFADWRGVLISGVVFGALHRGGGRNVAFAVWASFVGCLYGFAFLLTQNIYVPIIAHSTANLFSAMTWLSSQDQD